MFFVVTLGFHPLTNLSQDEARHPEVAFPPISQQKFTHCSVAGRGGRGGPMRGGRGRGRGV